MKSVSLLSFLALLGTVTASHAEWTRLPFAAKVPVNLADKSVGAILSSSEGIGESKALISGGSSEGALLSEGKDEAVIELAGKHSLNEVRFTNEGAEGKIAVSTSVDSKAWQPAGQSAFAAPDQGIVVRFAYAEARYLKVVFEISKGGVVRTFRIFGATTDMDFRLTKNSASDAGTVNLAGGIGGARAIYAFPPPLNTDEEELKKGIFRFPKTKERFRTIIYDLGAPRLIKQFATTYSERPTRIEIFAFTELPEKEDWRGKITLDETIFDRVKPVAEGEDAKGVGHIKLLPAKPIIAQFLALRFEPNYNRRAHAQSERFSWSDAVAFVLAPAVLVDTPGWFSQGHYVVQNIDPNGQNDPGWAGDSSFTASGCEIQGSDPAGGGYFFQPLFNTTGGPGNHTSNFNTSEYPPIWTSSVFSSLFATGTGGSPGAGGPSPFAVLPSPAATTLPVPKIAFPGFTPFIKISTTSSSSGGTAAAPTAK